MVKEADYDEVAYRQMHEQDYAHHPHRDPDHESERQKSTWHRFWSPLGANYEVKRDLYDGREPTTNFDKATGRFPSPHHSYAEHLA